MRIRSRRPLRIITVCATTLGGLGAAGALALTHTTPPAPRIVSGPGHSTLRRVASFRFLASGGGVRFLCSVDRSPFRACHSPARLTHQRLGTHVFRVEALTASGAVSDATPYRWTILAPTPPLVISSPAAGRSYNAAAWSATCPEGPGVCGTVAVVSGRLSVRIAIRSAQTSRYWTGQGYSAPKVTWVAAKLFAPRGPAGARRRAWFYPLALPLDGLYSVSVRAVSGKSTLRVRPHARKARRHASLGTTLAQRTVSFTVDSAAPGTPAPPTGPTTPSSPQPVAVTISGQIAGALYPGGASETVPITVANPGDATIYLTSVGVALPASGLPAGCPADGFQISEPSLPATGVAVPAHGSVTLSTVGLGAASIRMLETGSNQDPCQSATLGLILTGSAHS